jgi:plastocyanin
VSIGGPVAIQATINGKTGSGQLTVNTARITVDWPGNAATTPLVITTCASQSIIWHNADSVNFHSATGTTGPPTTGEIMPGAQSFPQSFPGPGTYSFHCDDHPNETGTVIIR